MAEIDDAELKRLNKQDKKAKRWDLFIEYWGCICGWSILGCCWAQGILGEETLETRPYVFGAAIFGAIVASLMVYNIHNRVSVFIDYLALGMAGMMFFGMAGGLVNPTLAILGSLIGGGFGLWAMWRFPPRD